MAAPRKPDVRRRGGIGSAPWLREAHQGCGVPATARLLAHGHQHGQRYRSKTVTSSRVLAVRLAVLRQADICGKPSCFIFNSVSQEYGIGSPSWWETTWTQISSGCHLWPEDRPHPQGVHTRDVKSNQESDCVSKNAVPDFHVDNIADLC
ncbi:Phosphoglycolate phosphatase [Tupaia chinensis]|uniref:Phosphoglycolate phosphatase n=1 Tax=Tupaia chinensis TaxID=246437 RepID=L9KNF6_TUPCH|nr:Phosphoglycolate phosphatase [Tupaia chinensis]